MDAILILTRNCNLSCAYCDVKKTRSHMNRDIVEVSVDFLGKFLDSHPLHSVKFFGGEPLLEKKSLLKIIPTLQEITPKTIFKLTTNGILLDDTFVDFCIQKNVELSISLDGPETIHGANRKTPSGQTQFATILANTQKYAPYLRVNQVITTDSAKDFFKSFRYIFDLGIRRFNFLPAYYKPWTKHGLAMLQKGFDEILDFAKTHQNLSFVNAEIQGDTPFFNTGIVIDTDGQLYGTNLILSGVFEKHKKEFVIGNVSSGIEKNIFQNHEFPIYLAAIENCLKKHYSPEILQSVKYADLLLTHFVHEWQAHRN